MTGIGEGDRPLPITGDGIWMDLRMAPLAEPRPALFLDRDGVIVRDTGFLSNPDQVTVIPETAALMRRANQARVPVLVVTNQSGIDRGLLDWNDFAAVEAAIARLLEALGARSDATAACPFHPEHTDGYDDDHARWRKPAPGLLVALAETLGIEMSRSWLLGDRSRDIEAARDAGLAGGILLSDPSGGGEPHGHEGLGTPDFVALSAASANQAEQTLLATGFFRKHDP